jgi:hypothetical protein
MKPVSDEDELALRSAFADRMPCIFIQFLMNQDWVPEDCRNKKVCKKIFYKFLRDRDYKKYIKEFPE